MYEIYDKYVIRNKNNEDFLLCTKNQVQSTKYNAPSLSADRTQRVCRGGLDFKAT